MFWQRQAREEPAHLGKVPVSLELHLGRNRGTDVPEADNRSIAGEHRDLEMPGHALEERLRARAAAVVSVGDSHRVLGLTLCVGTILRPES